MKIKTAAQRNRELTKRPRPRPAGACRICLEPETFELAKGSGRGPSKTKDMHVSSLAGGICRDRAACEERAPQLGLFDA